jgi:hypothetical protein
MNRREVIKEFMRTLLGAGAFSYFVSCTQKTEEYDLGKVEHCGDMEGLEETELSKRKQLGYTDETPIADNTCGNCQLFLPPKEGQKCGGCQLFNGPVFEVAYCTYWAPRVSNA